MSSLKIGEVAERAGVGVETVRFYERRGLLPEPPRRASGYRAFPPESVERLRFIRRSQRLGFSLAEIRDLLALHPESRHACSAVREHAEEKLADVRGRIRDLRAVERALVRLASACADNETLGVCPLLESLGQHEN